MADDTHLGASEESRRRCSMQLLPDIRTVDEGGSGGAGNAADSLDLHFTPRAEPSTPTETGEVPRDASTVANAGEEFLTAQQQDGPRRTPPTRDETAANPLPQPLPPRQPPAISPWRTIEPEPLVSRCTMRPDCSVRKVWDVIQVATLLYVAVSVPVRVGLELSVQGWWYVLDLLIDLYFLLDIASNFMTGFEDPMVEDYVLDGSKIAWRYLKGWFVIDVVSCLPIDLVIRITAGRLGCSLRDSCSMKSRSAGQLFRLFKIMRLVRLVKLLRLFRVARLFERYQDDLYELMRFMPIVKQLMLIMFLTHITGCMFYFFSTEEFRSPSERAAIADGTLQSWIESEWGENYTQVPAVDRYVTSCYWAATTLTTVGYGDVVSSTKSERVFSIITVIIGTFYVSYIIASVTSLLQVIHRREEAHNRKMETVRDFVAVSKLPRVIRQQVLAFFRRQMVHDYNARGLLMELPFQLRSHILRHLYRDLIRHVPFFKDCDQVFITELCSRLQPVVYLKGQMVFQRGEIGREMCIVVRGECELLDKNLHKVHAVLQAGSYFGEGAVLGDYKRYETVRARTTCTLCIIKAMEMDDLIRSYPRMYPRLQAVYLRRRNKMGYDNDVDEALNYFGPDSDSGTEHGESPRTGGGQFREMSPVGTDSKSFYIPPGPSFIYEDGPAASMGHPPYRTQSSIFERHLVGRARPSALGDSDQGESNTAIDRQELQGLMNMMTMLMRRQERVEDRVNTLVTEAREHHRDMQQLLTLLQNPM